MCEQNARHSTTYPLIRPDASNSPRRRLSRAGRRHSHRTRSPGAQRMCSLFLRPAEGKSSRLRAASWYLPMTRRWWWWRRSRAAAACRRTWLRRGALAVAAARMAMKEFCVVSQQAWGGCMRLCFACSAASVLLLRKCYERVNSCCSSSASADHKAVSDGGDYQFILFCPLLPRSFFPLEGTRGVPLLPALSHLVRGEVRRRFHVNCCSSIVERTRPATLTRVPCATPAE